MTPTYWPLGNGRIVTSPFGQRAGGFHTGVDFGRSGGSAGMPVYAIKSGTVLYCGAAQGYGGPDPSGWIVIDSPNPDGCWEYGHIIRLPHIRPGLSVQAGEQIGVINPDRTTNGGVDPHLHVSFMPDGYDPDLKVGPMPRLRDAQEPKEITTKELNVPNKPDFNEYWVSSPSFSPRGGAKVDLFLLHTQEGPGNADSLARYLSDGRNQVSYHYTVSQDPKDAGVTVCDVVDTDYASWSVLSANPRSINLCFAGSSVNWLREQWMAQSKAIDVAAYLAVQDCRKYGVAIKVMGPPYASPPPGISDHAYVTRYLKDGSHSDVGPNFPWDYFAAAVKKYANPGASSVPPNPSTPPSYKYPSRDEMILQIWEQLFGPRAAGWPQLGGKTLIDAVADIEKRLK